VGERRHDRDTEKMIGNSKSNPLRKKPTTKWQIFGDKPTNTTPKKEKNHEN